MKEERRAVPWWKESLVRGRRLESDARNKKKKQIKERAGN